MSGPARTRSGASDAWTAVLPPAGHLRRRPPDTGSDAASKATRRRHRNRIPVGLLACVIAQFAPATDISAQSRIGRLFSSPEQRVELDRLRDDPGSGEAMEPVPEATGRESRPRSEPEPTSFAATLNGVVMRSDGHRVAWIDGVETGAGAETPTGVRVETDLVRGSRFRVRLSAGRTSAVLEPGQSVDENGRVRNGYERRTAAAGAPGDVAADSPRADKGTAAPAGRLQSDSRPLPAHRVQEPLREAQAPFATSGERAPGARDSGDQPPMTTSSTERESAR